MAQSWDAVIRRFARSVRDRRLGLELSQSDLARLAGISMRRLQQIEAGDQINPSLKVIYAISKALQADISDLLVGEFDRALRNRAPKK